MKLIHKSSIDSFLKSKGYSLESSESDNENLKDLLCWSKSDKQKVVLPKKEIFQSTELSSLFRDDALLKEFRNY